MKMLSRALNRKHYGRESAELVLIGFILLYSVTFSYFTVIKHAAFRSYAWDLGLFNQSFWTTLNEGRFFYHTLEQFINPDGSFFAVHFSPILILVLPVYALCQRPETFLVLQSIIIASGSYPLYLLAKEEFENRALIGLIFALTYLLYPPLQGVNWFDFHVQSFFPLFVFSAMYFYKKENWKGYFIFVVLTLMVEEQISLIIAFWGAYLILLNRNEIYTTLKKKSFRNRRLLIPLCTVLLALMWLASTKYVKSTLFPVNPDFLREYRALDNWKALGIDSDPLLMPFHILLNPEKALNALLFDFPLKFLFLLFLFAPLIFLPIRSSSILISFVWLVPALLSNNSAYYKLGYQYPAYIIPFIFSAAIHGLKNTSMKDAKTVLNVSKTMLLVALVMAFALSPISPVPKFFDVTYVPPQIGFHENRLHEILSLIPPNASVLTQNNIFPHLSCRSNAYSVYPHSMWLRAKDKVFTFMNNTTSGVNYILADLSTDFLTFEYALDRAKDGSYGVYASADKIVLFRLNYTGTPLIYEPLTELHDFSTLKLSNGVLVVDNSSTSGTILHHPANLSSSGVFWFGPYTPLPPGNYTVTVRLKAESTNATDLLTIDATANGGRRTLSYKVINYMDFDRSNVWQNFTLCFELKEPISDVEIRGRLMSTECTIDLDFLEIRQE